MTERQVPQKVRDAEYAETVAEDVFAATEGMAVILHLAAAGLSIIFGAPELAPVFLVTAAGMHKLSEKIHSNYRQRREREIPQETETPVLMNY